MSFQIAFFSVCVVGMGVGGFQFQIKNQHCSVIVNEQGASIKPARKLVIPM